MTEVVFVDWAPIKAKTEIRQGAQVRRYYAWNALNELAERVTPFRNTNGHINWKSVLMMFNGNSKIWVEYGCGALAHFFVIFASLVQSRKTLILNIHDFTIQQQRDTNNRHSSLKKLRLEFTERLLISRANTLILPSPYVLDYFSPKKSHKIIIMPPGVGEDELPLIITKKVTKNEKIRIAAYFGSIRRKDMIPTIIKLFSQLDDWELLIVGQQEGSKIELRNNVRYLGIVSHDRLNSILNDVDALIVPYPKNEYFDKAMPIKLGYALQLCKPIIASRLKGISEYVSYVGLENNVIYIDDWNLDTLKDALKTVHGLNIDAEKTIEKMKKMAWEPRFIEVVKFSLENKSIYHSGIDWM